MNETGSYRPEQAPPATGNGGETPSQAAGREPSAPHASDRSALPNDIPIDLIDHPRYRILKKLGNGGMGTVYQAEHKLMHRSVALKVIRPHLVAQPHVVERFQREVRAAAQLTHPNIVAAYDAEQAGDCHFLIMEFVEGTDLARWLKEHGPLPVSDACACAREAALGLQHAHERQMVHRDLKPSNLLRTPQGQIKIADFGLAHVAQVSPEDQAVLTETGVVLGTPDYMAPEQANDPSSTDCRTDIYSLGCTLYQMLGDRVPFPGGGRMDKLVGHARGTPTSLAQLRPDLSPPILEVVERMMAKDPEARYQTAAAVAAALEPWCHPLPETVAWLRPRQTSTRALLALCVLVAGLFLGVGGLTYVALHHPPDNPSGGQAQHAPLPSTTEQQPPAPPDLTKLQPGFDDDFADPTKSVLLAPGEPPPSKDAPRLCQGTESFFHDHRLVVRFPPGRSANLLVVSPQHPHRQYADFACLLSCRFSGQGEVGWGFASVNEGARYGVLVSVRPNGAVEIAEYDRESPASIQQPKFGRFPAPIAEPVGGLSHLFVTLQGRKLTVFVNGRAVGNPIILDRGFGPVPPGIALWRVGTGEARAEFSRFALWRLPETRPETGP